MKKILLLSDNHHDMRSLQIALQAHPDCDYYLHCGDSEFPKNKLRPFLSVRGNNDYDYSYPREITLDIEGRHILMTHGSYFEEILVNRAKDLKCDTVFYGHTHTFTDKTLEGIRLVNPGSTRHNRDWSEPCYAIVMIDGKDLTVKRINIEQ